MLYVGIDPGKTGGIAVLNEIGRIVSVTQMPAEVPTVLQVLQHAVDLADYGEIKAALEEVWTVGPQMGRVSAFSFGREYGKAEACLWATEIPFTLVRPQQWQSALGCQTRGDKNVSKARAEELFGGQGFKITHAIADALLIAEWCRRQSVG